MTVKSVLKTMPVVLLLAMSPVFAAQAQKQLLTITLENRQVPLERTWEGTVEAVHKSTLSAETSARVAEINFDVDDYVEKNAILIRFTNTRQQAALDQARAAVQAAEARQKQVSADWARIEGLYEQGVVSKSQYDQLAAEVETSTANLEASKSALKAALEQYEFTVVRAPYAGIVTERHVELGETVNPGQPLMSGLSLDKLRIVSDIPQSEIAAVREMGRAEIVLSNGERVPVDNMVIFPYAEQRSRTFRVRMDISEASTGLQPGMMVKVAMTTGMDKRMLVPESAILRRSELESLYVVGSNGDIALRQVRTGRHFDGELEVLAGVREGEVIALDPVKAAQLMLAERSQ